MSSTVVGSALLSMLTVAGSRVLKKAPRRTMNPLVTAQRHSANVRRINGTIQEEKLRLHEVGENCRKAGFREASTLCQLASETVQHCPCEGNDKIAKSPILICKDCGTSACCDCQGVPKHNYDHMKFNSERRDPWIFVQTAKEILPTTLKIVSKSIRRDNDILRTLKRFGTSRQMSSSGEDDNDSVLSDFLKFVRAALVEEIHIVSIQRSSSWRVRYESSRLTLELVVEQCALEWILYVKPPPSAPANCPLRATFKNPIARMAVTSSSETLFDGHWKLFLPLRTAFEVTIRRCGVLIPSWRSELGLEAFKEEQVFDRLEVSCSEKTGIPRAPDIFGEYRLLPACGTANRMLHVKRSLDNKSKIFLLLDPDPYGPLHNDDLCFSRAPWRLQHGESRDLVARLTIDVEAVSARDCKTSKWQILGGLKEGPQTALCTVHTQAVDADLNLGVPIDRFSSVKVPCGDIRDFNFSVAAPHSCHDALFLLLKCRFPWSDAQTEAWAMEGLCIVDEKNENTVDLDSMWLEMATPSLCDYPKQWTRMFLGDSCQRCTICAPVKPKIKWIETQIKDSNLYRLSPLEDPAEAGPYETSLKNRPSPFLVKLERKYAEKSAFVEISVALNIQTLAHRAASILLRESTENSGDQIEAYWRLLTARDEAKQKPFRPFQIPDNKKDEPFHFKFSAKDLESGSAFKLRDDQARSLRWMRSRDSSNAAPFYEEIMEESVCAKLGWRLEVKTSRRKRARGGLVADDVGFGKTITMLALVKDGLAKAIEEAKCSSTSLIGVKATLIIAPQTLVPQWEDEIRKFWPSCRLIRIRDNAQLRRRAVEDIENADIVLIPITLLANEDYLERVTELAAMPSVPVLGGAREHAAWYSRVSHQLNSTIPQLKSARSPEHFVRILEERSSQYQRDTTIQNAEQSKRKRGKAFAQAHEAKGATVKEMARCKKIQTDKPARRIRGFESARDYSHQLYPVLQMFEFQRKVVDEQSYVDETELETIKSLKARVNWLLSGTPYLRDFIDLKRLASFFSFHLGLDDVTPGFVTEENAKALQSAMTGTCHSLLCEGPD